MNPSHQQVENALRDVFSDLSEDLDDDAADFDRDTRLIDLGLESISLVYLVSELQQHFGLGDSLFRQLRAEGRLLKDMTVGDIVDAVVATGTAGEVQHG